MTEQKAYESVVNYFSKLVISGRLQTNDRLPSDATVAKALGVNVLYVTQILQQMESEGIITSQNENERYLNCDIREYMLKTMRIIMDVKNIHYSDLVNMRRDYEKRALDLAMQEITEDELARMKHCLEGIGKAQSINDSADCDVQFHRTLIEAAHNRMLLLYCDVLADIQELFIHNFHYEIFHDEERGEALKKAHWNMYESLVSKNHLMGRLALRNHFEIVEHYVEKMRDIDTDEC